MTPEELIEDLNDALLSDNFRFINILGRGSFGIVVSAYSSQLDKVVAIKITQQVDQQSEAELLQECSHPNIVKLYKVLIASNHLFLVMERLQGTTLDVLLKGDQLEFTEIRNIMTQILNALVFLHRKGIIHRDLKPENIFICENNYVKLIDLGLGYQIMYRGYIGQQVGTPLYIAPEIINGQEQTQAVDIFSLGIIFFQMVCHNKHPIWSEGLCKKEYYQKVNHDFSIVYPESMSKMAKDFVENTVTFQAIDRMTAIQCLEHPWMLGEERKSHPVTNREIKNSFIFTGKFCQIIKSLWILKLLKERCYEEIYYQQTQRSDEIDEALLEDPRPMTSRFHTETLITVKPLKTKASSFKLQLVRNNSHQDLAALKNKILTTRKYFNMATRYKNSLDFLPPKANSLKKITSQLPSLGTSRQSSFRYQ